MIRTLLMLPLLLGLLGGCAATVRPPLLEIEPWGGHGHGGGFCPPGQARKGRC